MTQTAVPSCDRPRDQNKYREFKSKSRIYLLNKWHDSSYCLAAMSPFSAGKNTSTRLVHVSIFSYGPLLTREKARIQINGEFGSFFSWCKTNSVDLN